MQLVKRLLVSHFTQSRSQKSKPRRKRTTGTKIGFVARFPGKVTLPSRSLSHLGAALSLGEVCGDHLVCPFHGFEFDAQGQCRLIPANGKAGRIPAGMETASYEVQEAHGFIWLWWGEKRAEYPPLPYFEDFTQDWHYHTITADWQTHYTRAIENQLDVAHLAFVHRTTIGAGGRSFVEGPYVESNNQELKVWVFNRKDLGMEAREQKDWQN